MTTAAKKTQTRKKRRKTASKKTTARRKPQQARSGKMKIAEMQNSNGTYTTQTKAKYIHEMLEGNVSANEMSKRTGISQPTLSRWLRKARDEKKAQAAPKKTEKPVKTKKAAGKVRVIVFDSINDYLAAGGVLADDGQPTVAFATGG